MTNPTPTDQDDDLLDFSFLDLPPGAKPRRPRPEMDRIEAGFARAAWLIDQGIHDTDPLSTRNRRK